MNRGWTLDAGALIAYERGEQWMREVVAAADRGEATLTVPAVVVAETWRGGPTAYWTGKLLKAATVEPLDQPMAKQAGELCGRTGASTIDSIVAVSAATRGDTVITSDPGDLRVLADALPTIRVWGPPRRG